MYVYYESSTGQCGGCGEWTVSPGDDLLFRLYLAGDVPRPMALRCEECLALAVRKGLADCGRWELGGEVIRERMPDRPTFNWTSQELHEPNRGNRDKVR